MSNLRELVRYPAAVIGLLMISVLVGFAIYALATLPYDEAVRLWRGGEAIWYNTPKKAAPVWTNWFRKEDLPATITIDSADGSIVKTREQVSEDVTDIQFAYTFDYPYTTFPEDISIYFDTKYDEKPPHVSLTWLTPDGREIRIASMTAESSLVYRLDQDSKLERRLQLPDSIQSHEGLFMDPESEELVALPGVYTLQVSASVFEPESDVDAEVVIYGQVYGLAGTDHRRRDITVALLWGTPIALAFGLLAAIGTSVTTLVIAAIGTWYGGWVDALIQRITEVNLILPVLPILIMVGTFYSKSLWVILGVIILLGIFGGGIKTYRAIFLQVKESPYIEAAQAYGANDARIIFSYLLPRIIPTLVPNLVTLVPSFVFLEAALSVLGLGDPVMPTWGKVISDARVNGALYQGNYYWILQPSALLMLTGLAFSLVGFALDRIFNPRLRGR
ncbi:MAG: ABC transporter permease [Anaerolineae bacterium]|nr:ABC transporter permease [Anaerolineae bacterium]